MLYLAKRNRLYYIRLRVPLDVSQYFASAEIKRSLHTPSYKQANSLAKIFIADAEKVFLMIRSNTLSYPQICKIIDKLIIKRLSLYDESASKAIDEHGYDKAQRS